MPYSNPEEAKQAARERMRRIRENRRENEKQGEQVKTVGRTGVKPAGEQPADVTPVTPANPADWSDRRNYTPAYLRCLDEQGGQLTEASAVAMRSHRITDPGWCRRHSINSEVRPAREMTGPELREKLGKVCQALDREMSTLDGQKVNLQTMVRFGVEGPTIDVVSQWLSGRAG